MYVHELPQLAEVIHLPASRSTAPKAPVQPAVPADAPHARAARDSPPRRWPGYVLVACGVALVPWLVVLAVGLPTTATASHWALAWVGLDSMEALGLIATGVLTLRRDQRRPVVAAATAMLLVVDAWFDVTTAAAGSDFGSALAMALGAELPLALICAALALRPPRTHPRYQTWR